MRGERPGRPTHLGLSDRLWELIQECWNHTAKDRPKIEDVVKELIMMSVRFLFEVYICSLSLKHQKKYTDPADTVRKATTDHNGPIAQTKHPFYST